MKLAKRFFSWILEHLSYVQAILTFLVAIISGIAGICDNHLALVITLLVFVGSEFTIITIGYLEQILKAVKKNKLKVEVEEVIVDDSQQWTDLVNKAQFDIFLSGVTMGSLYQERRLFHSIPENVKINILVHNPHDTSVTELYCTVCKPKASITELKSKQRLFSSLAHDLSIQNNVCIKMTNDPLFIQFVACDVFSQSHNSYIRAQHCLRKYVSSTDKPQIDNKLIYGVKKDTEVYSVYRNQILKLWETASDYRFVQENIA